MKTFTMAVAAFLISLVATNDAAAQTKPDVLQLPSIEMGKLVSFDIFTERGALGLQFDFEGGTIRSLWTRGGGSMIQMDGDASLFRSIWTPRGGSLVGFSFGVERAPDFGLGRWRSNTQRPSPAILIGLLFDPDITSISAAPLTLQYDRTGRMTITLDAFSADRLFVR